MISLSDAASYAAEMNNHQDETHSPITSGSSTDFTRLTGTGPASSGGRHRALSTAGEMLDQELKVPLQRQWERLQANLGLPIHPRLLYAANHRLGPVRWTARWCVN